MERGVKRLRQKRVPNALMAVVVVGFLIPCGLVGSSIAQWRMPNVQKAPVLVVGHVQSVRREFRLPQGTVPGQAEIWAMRADVAVRQSFAGLGGNAPSGGSHVEVRFLAYGEKHTIVNGSPSLLFFGRVSDGQRLKSV